MLLLFFVSNDNLTQSSALSSVKVHVGTKHFKILKINPINGSAFSLEQRFSVDGIIRPSFFPSYELRAKCKHSIQFTCKAGYGRARCKLLIKGLAVQIWQQQSTCCARH